LGEVRKAIEYYEQHLEIAREIGDRRGEADGLYNWGDELVKLGETDRAIEMIEAALAIYERIESSMAETARKRLAKLKGE
jgi:tetratricopeptide (TPR) repeat protein